MPNILAIDTLGRETTVACIVNDSVYSVAMPTTKHADTVGDCLRAIASEHAISFRSMDLIVANIGPGSFTGLRVGLASIQAIAWASSTLVWPVSHLSGLAYQVHWSSVLQRDVLAHKLTDISFDAITWPSVSYHVAMDARMQEAYHAIYYASRAFLEVQTPDHLLPLTALSHDGSKANVCIGDAWSERVHTSSYHFTWAEVMVMVAYFGYETVVNMQPVDTVNAHYVRNKVTN